MSADLPPDTRYDQSRPASVILDRRPDGEPTRPWLVLVRCGAGSLHKSWFRPDLPRKWDLILNYWQQDPAGPDPHAEIITGGGFNKMIAVGQLHAADPLLFGSYRAILLLDDDLDLDPAGLDLLFEVFEAHDLLLAHPSIDRTTYSSYRSHFQRDGLALRYMSFIEVMSPMFSQAAFLTCAESFELSRSTWGVAHIWPHLLGYPDRGIGIIDAFTIRHTKPVRLDDSPLYRYFKANGVDPIADLDAVPALYGIERSGIQTLGSVPLEEGLAAAARYRARNSGETSADAGAPTRGER